MRFPRSSGIFCHVTSLPSEYGVGDFGQTARAFVDFLADAGQTIWQVLPLNPPSRGNSPYSCYSVFANNPILVSPNALVEDGWLKELPAALAHDSGHVDFKQATRLKKQLLEEAFEQSSDQLPSSDYFAAFCEREAWWLDEFARFEAIMRTIGTLDWTTWPEAIARRDETSLSQWDAEHPEQILFSKFVQFVLDEQWNRLKQYANEKRVRIYGDLSIFVAHESADVWANQELFHLGSDGKATLVAGVPPDYFSETGQRWGNPLYRWDVMESNGFRWWTKRFRRGSEQFDLLRVDHFRGFESYWEIPASAETAIEGNWKAGPGRQPFDEAQRELGELPIIAEDLGLITDAVHELRDSLAFPPMRVLQFGFDTEHDDFHRPSRYPEHCVAYTGTHDNDTVVAWYRGMQEKGASDIIDQWIDTGQDVPPQLVRLVLESNADTVIIPLQDLLGLGSESRMNTPGTADGNWAWRVESKQLTATLSRQLRTMTENANRCHG